MGPSENSAPLAAEARARAPHLPRMLIHEGGGRGRSPPRARVQGLASVLAALGAAGVHIASGPHELGRTLDAVLKAKG